MSAIVEDGSGKVDAEVYQSETATATQLTEANLTAFSLLDPGEQTLALTTATAEGDRIAQDWECEKPTCFYGHPVNPLQALFFPKKARGVPASIILACSLLAEANAIDDTDAEGWNSVPETVSEVAITDDVKVKFKAGEGGVTDRTATTLRNRAQDLIQSACPRVSTFGIVATA